MREFSRNRLHTYANAAATETRSLTESCDKIFRELHLNTSFCWCMHTSVYTHKVIEHSRVNAYTSLHVIAFVRILLLHLQLWYEKVRKTIIYSEYFIQIKSTKKSLDMQSTVRGIDCTL